MPPYLGGCLPLLAFFLFSVFQETLIRSARLYFSSVLNNNWSNALLECSPLDSTPVLFGWVSPKVANIFCLISIRVIFYIWIKLIMICTFRKSWSDIPRSVFFRESFYTFGRRTVFFAIQSLTVFSFWFFMNCPGSRCAHLFDIYIMYDSLPISDVLRGYSICILMDAYHCGSCKFSTEDLYNKFWIYVRYIFCRSRTKSIRYTLKHLLFYEGVIKKLSLHMRRFFCR